MDNGIIHKLKWRMWYNLKIVNDKPKNKIGKVLLWLAVIIAVLIIGISAYYSLNKKGDKSTEQTLTVPEVRASLLANSKISFPGVERENITDANNISKEIKAIMAVEIKNGQVVASEVSYAGGKKGQIIKFNINKSLFDYYWDMQKKSTADGWSILFGSRGTLATILEIENKNLTVRVLGTETTKDSISIHIQTIQK